ncbi:MAG: PadR family transcriptional regulator [Gemmatimonadetes bacterium]|nr:PadR family transcriptional regulator [Gemmatimonadota bacterium]
MTIDRELMRGAGPVAVLQLLEQREMYGYELIGALDEATGGVLAMGQSTLYPMLYHLEAKGLIRGKWRRAASGRRRKYYSITAAGQKRLDRHRTEWREVLGALRGLGLLGAGGGGAT